MRRVVTSRLTVATGVMLALLTTPTAGRTEEKDATAGVFTLGEIEVSNKADTNKNLTVDKIDAEEMRDFNRTSIADAANLLPGVTASVTGARNEQTLYVRGFDIKHVPLFLDGIPIYVPYDGYPDLARFKTFDLSEVVVSKGFTSVLYGPNTMGGVINMVSRRPEKAFEGEIGTGISSGNTYNLYGNVGTNQDKWYLQAGASYMNSDYFPLSDNFKPTKTEDGDHRNNSYQEDEKINLKVGLTPNKKDEYAFNYIYQHGEKGTPPYTGIDTSMSTRYWQWPYWDKQSYYFTSTTDFDKIGYFKSRLYHDIFQNSLNSYDDATYTTVSKPYAFKSKYDDYTNGGSLEFGTPYFNYNLLKLAVHYKEDVHREQGSATAPWLHFKDQIFSTGLEDTITFSKSIYAIAGISYDTIKTEDAENLVSNKIVDFPKESTSGVNPQLGLFYQPTKDDTLHVSVAQKTRLPTIKDRYSYRLGSAIPNPNLDPEKSINYEAGYETKLMEKIHWKTTAFYNDVTDYIQLMKVPDPTDSSKKTQQNQNIGEVDLYGIETDISAYLLSSLQIGGNYTYTYADNKTDSSILTNIPKHKLVSYVKYSFLGSWSLLADLELDSMRYSSSDGVEVARGFTVADVKVGYDFSFGLHAEAGISNVFDRNYELQEGYPEAGRTFFANLRYTF